MSKLVARHAFSEANDRNNWGTPLFGHPDAPIKDWGFTQSKQMGRALRDLYKIDPSVTRVAVSTMLRTQQTAFEAGFKYENQVQYALLDEITTGLELEEVGQLINEKRYPEIGLHIAELILENPPEEGILVMHGLTIACLCKVAGVADQYDRFIPPLCGIRRLPI